MLQTAEITWENIHEHGSLWYQHLKLRKRLFVEEKRWNIPHNQNVEWDQYDTGNTVYAVTHTQGRAIAASRINRCDYSSSHGSYMIKDACAGSLHDIPADILDGKDLPIDPRVWEASRFTVDPELSSYQRNAALMQNANDLASIAKGLGACRLIALMPPAYIRWLSSIGLETVRLGPTRVDGSGGRICVMSMLV